MSLVEVVDFSSIVGIGAINVAVVEMLDATVDAADTGTVAGDIAIEAPFVAQDAVEQPVVHSIGLATPGFAFGSSVAKLHACSICFIDVC